MTPAADLTGTWNGSFQIDIDDGVDKICSFSGTINLELQQSGTSLSGNYDYSVTNTQNYHPEWGIDCSLAFSGSTQGSVDGSRITLSFDSWLLSGSFTTNLIKLSMSEYGVEASVSLSSAGSGTQSGGEELEHEQTVEAYYDEYKEKSIQYLKDGNFKSALTYFEKLVGLAPNDYFGWYGRGISFSALGQYSQAIDNLNEALDRNPTKYDVWKAGGDVYYKLNDCDNAYKYYSNAVKYGPTNSGLESYQIIAEKCAQFTQPSTELSENDPIAMGKDLVNLQFPHVELKEKILEVKDLNKRKILVFTYLKNISPEVARDLPDDVKNLIKESLKLKYESLVVKRLILEKLVADNEDGSVRKVEPDNKNAKSTNSVYYVNGILNSKEDVLKNAKTLANTIEKPVIQVYNRSEGALIDLAESALGKLGYLPPASETLKMKIKSDIAQGKPVEIHAHSQGAIITSAALYSLKNEDPEWFAKNAHKIKVSTYGGAAWTYPDGPDYKHRAFLLDPVSLFGGKGLQSLKNIKTPYSKGHFFDGFPNHSWKGYMENIHEFIINEHKGFFGGLDVKGLSKELNEQNPKVVEQVLKNLSENERNAVKYELGNLAVKNRGST